MTSKLEHLEARNAFLEEQLEARNTLQDKAVKEAEALSSVREQLALQNSAVQKAEALKDKITKEAETLREQLALKDSAAKELADRNALLEQKVAEAGKLLKQARAKQAAKILPVCFSLFLTRPFSFPPSHPSALSPSFPFRPSLARSRPRTPSFATRQMTSKLEKLVASNALLEQHAAEAIKVVDKASADAAFNAPLKALVLLSL
jgi:hypothetical protein